MHIILYEDHLRSQFLPLVFTRPIGELRFGIRTLSQQWTDLLTPSSLCHATEPYLAEAFPLVLHETNLLINARSIPSSAISEQIRQLEVGEVLEQNDEAVALHLNKSDAQTWLETKELPADLVRKTTETVMLSHVTHLFSQNDDAIKNEFARLSSGRSSESISSSATVIGDPNLIFIEEGASVEGCWLNTKNGPIYIGKDATVMEGSVLYGPIALCEHATIKAGSKIYGATTIGPHSKVGGEVSNSMIQGFSNKGHDGFLGNSILGEWCNLGADTNTSNLKNNYSDVRVWSYADTSFPSTGLTFCGLIMGDHSKCGINTMFNTGTVVGVNANIFGSGFPPKFIPSFSWGGSAGFEEYNFEKAMQVAEKVMARRYVELTESDRAILRHIFATSAPFRS